MSRQLVFTEGPPETGSLVAALCQLTIAFNNRDKATRHRIYTTVLYEKPIYKWLQTAITFDKNEVATWAEETGAPAWGHDQTPDTPRPQAGGAPLPDIGTGNLSPGELGLLVAAFERLYGAAAKKELPDGRWGFSFAEDPGQHWALFTPIADGRWCLAKASLSCRQIPAMLTDPILWAEFSKRINEPSHPAATLASGSEKGGAAASGALPEASYATGGPPIGGGSMFPGAEQRCGGDPA